MLLRSSKRKAALLWLLSRLRQFRRKLRRQFRRKLRPQFRRKLQRQFRLKRTAVANKAMSVPRQYVFRREMRRLLNLPRNAAIPATVVSRLIYGWGNPYSVGHEYARALLRYARSTDGPILECGSGLSTILLGLGAQRNGNQVWSLEDDSFWAEKVRSMLKRYHIKSVELLEVTIRDYGPYWWYDPPKERMPKNFSLVVCDGPGPPPRKSGLSGKGRYSLLPVMGSHLVPDCVVLLDDIDKETGAVTLRRWAEEFGVSYRVEGLERPFAVVVVPTTDGRRGG